jgi:hypothetical protein
MELLRQEIFGLVIGIIKTQNESHVMLGSEKHSGLGCFNDD